LKRRFLPLILIIVLLVTGCAKTTTPSVPAEETPNDESPMAVSDWPYEVSVESGNAAGIDINSEFTLTVTEDMAMADVQEGLSISPAIEYTVIEKSTKEFVIKPTMSLEKNKVYQVKMKGRSKDKDFTWAFQTQKDLKVINSIPGNRSEYIPMNSGIEIQFSHMDLSDVEKHITIEPAVEGEFSSNGYSVVFIPDALKLDTTYTVTISKGLSVKNSELSLEEDYLFTFKTQPESWNKRFNVGDTFLNYTTNQTHFVPVFMDNELASKDYQVEVYAFESSEVFLSDLHEFDRVYSFDKIYKEIPDYLSEIQSFEMTPVLVEQGYMSFYTFEMKDQLSQGYYLVKISLEGQTGYAFVQVNDLLIYNSEFEDKQFFWVLDSKTQDEISGAQITVEEEFSGKTGADGVAEIDYQKDADEYSYVTYAEISANNYPDFIMRSEQIFYRYMEDSWYPNYNVSNDYWKYLFTDRSTYLPTDEINIFGYLMPKKESTGNYQISLFSNDNGVDLIEEKNIRADSTGTFTESFAWKELAAGWYSITVNEGDTLILRHEFYINPYTKPVFKLTGSFDKNVISAGESITYDFTSSFFDGTPVPDMKFNYYLHLGDSFNNFVRTDQSGNASVEFTPGYETTSWRPVNAQMEIYNSDAEDQRIATYDHFSFLPKDKMIELEYDETSATPVMKVMGHEIDSSKFEDVYHYNYEELRGKPLNVGLNLQVTEIWYDKIEKGQVYDYINKVTRKTYDYVKRSKVIEDRAIDLSNGEYEFKMPYTVDSDSSFEVKVILNEGGGNQIIEEKNVNFYYRPYFEPMADYYTLKTDENQWQYGIGEEVNYHLDSGGPVEESNDDQLMVMYLQDGLTKYEIKSNLEGSLTFTEDMLPNIFIQGVYVNDGRIIKTAHPTQIAFDYSEREMEISVTADKEDYGPGGKVNLTIETLDSEGKPYPAQINVSIVDEAYFNLYSQSTDMLRSLYSNFYGTGIISEFTSSSHAGGMDMRMGGAEGGGADFATENSYYVRSEFKDTATFMAVSTDENGKGTLSFNLPDNLTSWRITYQGINNKMEADTDFININAKLPFFAVTIIGDLFIDGDQPSISLRAYGDEAVEDTSVDYRVVVVSSTGEEKVIEQTGIVGEYTNVDLGVLENGAYTITTYAKSGELKDAIEEHFNVVDSTVLFDNLTYYKVKKNMTFDEVFSNARISFFNENESTFYNSLLDLRYSSGKRVDQVLSGMMAQRFIKKNFEKDFEIWERALSDYQNYDGGIKLLPYSDSDSLMSTRVALASSIDFKYESLQGYFYNILYNKESDQGSVINALAGLATMDEPVLMEIRSMLLSDELSSMERIILALGLESLGDTKGAFDLYQKLLNEEAVFDPELTITLSEDDGINYLSKSLLATLAVKVGDNAIGDQLFDDIYLNQSKMELASLEMMTYLEYRDIMKSSQIQSLRGSVSVKYGQESESFELFGFESKSMTLTKEELASLKISKLEGNIGVYVDAMGGVDAMKKNKVNEFSIERSYSLGREETTEFEQSDLIKVTLNPTVPKKEHGTYEITDFVPAGFRFIKAEHGNYWYEESGQKMIFYYWESEKHHKPITYYIQAVMPGIYTADHAVIVKNGKVGTNFTDQVTLTVR
jgi:hypothetical protein